MKGRGKVVESPLAPPGTPPVVTQTKAVLASLVAREISKVDRVSSGGEELIPEGMASLLLTLTKVLAGLADTELEGETGVSGAPLSHGPDED